ncbi:MAG: hypothetical protein QHI48_04635 [Bacteroidota bacterium]|nr:hypothetical protein [Bacteroidota bacterium]
MKNIDDPQMWSAELVGASDIKDGRYAGCRVLLFDDLYRFGETLNAIASVLVKKGKVDADSVLTVTKTRMRR